MPRKRRQGKRAHVMALGVLAATFSVRAWEDYWGGPAEGRAAWQSLGGQIPSHRGTRSEVFWAYTDGVPEELRSEVPRGDPRWILGGVGEPPRQFLETEVAWRGQHRARLAWLLNGGQDHLRPGETEAIVRELKALDAA